MKYRVSHNTTYDYGESVPLCQNQAHLAPRDDARQMCLGHRLSIEPEPSSLSERVDYFGNRVTLFSITEGHERLSVTSTSVVDVRRTSPADEPSPAWESVRDSLARDLSNDGLEAYQFCFASRHIPRQEVLAEYARVSFTPQRPILEAVQDLTARIHDDITYDPNATSVSTRVEEVFANRRGVCQDLAHLQIACLRSLNLAARYISGYLRTLPTEGRPRLIGADESHAWLSVYAGEAGWVDVDPTNNLFAASDHIVVAWGRDYADVCPINGMFVGRGEHRMKVAVEVSPLD